MKWFIEFGCEELTGGDLYDTKWCPLRTVILDFPSREEAIAFANTAGEVVAAQYSGPDGEEIDPESVSAQVFELERVMNNYESSGKKLIEEVKNAVQQEDEE